MEDREIDENPFLKILNLIKVLRKEKEIFSQEQIKAITSVKTINLLQSLQLCAKKKMEVASYLVKNDLKMLIFLEEIEGMAKTFKKKVKLGSLNLMFYCCKVSDHNRKDKSHDS
jgi:hypothetical protein